jgi:hypothetical protein
MGALNTGFDTGNLHRPTMPYCDFEGTVQNMSRL